MTLTSTMTNRRVRTRRANPARLDLSLDIAILAVAAVICAFLFFQGGLETLLGAGLGGLIGARHNARISGALAGLWVGTLFAGFFHGVLTALIAPLLLR